MNTRSKNDRRPIGAAPQPRKSLRNTPRLAQVCLRALEVDDLHRTHRWHNDPALYADLVGGFRFVSKGAEQEWLHANCLYSMKSIALAICVAGSGKHIGNIYLRDIDWVSRHAHLQIFIGEAPYRGKGYGRAAVAQLMRHAYRDLGLRRLYLYVLAHNKRAERLYERCGFEREGVLRGHAFKDGCFEDVIIMGGFASE